MNQNKNRIEYGLLTEEEKAQFCEHAKERGIYEFYCLEEWTISQGDSWCTDYPYRLKMIQDEIYYVECQAEGGELQKWLFVCNIGEHTTSKSKSYNLETGKKEPEQNAKVVCEDKWIIVLRPATKEERKLFNPEPIDKAHKYIDIEVYLKTGMGLYVQDEENKYEDQYPIGMVIGQSIDRNNTQYFATWYMINGTEWSHPCHDEGKTQGEPTVFASHVRFMRKDLLGGISE